MSKPPVTPQTSAASFPALKQRMKTATSLEELESLWKVACKQGSVSGNTERARKRVYEQRKTQLQRGKRPK